MPQIGIAGGSDVTVTGLRNNISARMKLGDLGIYQPFCEYFVEEINYDMVHIHVWL